MKRCVLILTGESSDRPGGVEHFVRELTKGLEGRGYTARVLHRGNSAPSWFGSPKGKIGRYVTGNLLGYFLRESAQKAMTSDVAAVISNGDLGWCAPTPIAPDARRIHMYHGTYRAQAEAIRPFISYRGYLYMKWWSSEVIERLGGRKKIVLCNSDQTREEVSRFFGREGTVVWLPLDTAHFRPRSQKECRAALGVNETDRIGLFVGSTAPTKGLGTVRSLIDALPEVHWILAVGGEVPSDLEITGRVRLFCDVPEASLPTIYGAADFVVCSSYYESFGYVVAEGLACGTPVIASPGGASRAFLESPPLDRLLISDPSSVDQFAAAAREILCAPEFYRQAVEKLVRPKLTELMSPENWCRRFCEVTGL